MKEIAKFSDLHLIIFRSQFNHPTSIAQDSPSPDMQGRAQLIKMKEDAQQVYKFANALVVVVLHATHSCKSYRIKATFSTIKSSSMQ